MTNRPLPNPTRDQALIPAEMVLAFYVASTMLIGVFGGGALSALLSGHGWCLPGYTGMLHTLAGLVTLPGDPAAAWPTDPRPGHAWLTWTCIAVVAIAWCSAIGMVTAEFDLRRRNRQRNDGLGGASDLRTIGLDGSSAARKSAKEYPRLAGERQPRSARGLLRVLRRRERG